MSFTPGFGGACRCSSCCQDIVNRGGFDVFSRGKKEDRRERERKEREDRFRAASTSARAAQMNARNNIYRETAPQPLLPYQYNDAEWLPNFPAPVPPFTPPGILPIYVPPGMEVPGSTAPIPGINERPQPSIPHVEENRWINLMAPPTHGWSPADQQSSSPSATSPHPVQSSSSSSSSPSPHPGQGISPSGVPQCILDMSSTSSETSSESTRGDYNDFMHDSLYAHLRERRDEKRERDRRND